MRELSLHQLVATDATPIEMVRIAAELGCRHVCLFTQSANLGGLSYPLVADEDVKPVRAEMDACGVTLLGMTSFAMSRRVRVEDCAAGLARGAELGGSVASVRITDDDEARATDNFGRFCELARSHGVEASIEFTGFEQPQALDDALRVIRNAGEGNVTIDALHLMRTGAGIAAVERLDPSLIGYVQICDGPLQATKDMYFHEAGYERLPPGHGEFPLRRLIALMPAHLPLSLEIPMTGLRESGASARDRARFAVDSTRELLEQLNT